MSAWRVTLADGQVFESADTKARDVPRHPRPICIAQRGKPAERWGPCLVNGDFYLHRTGPASGWSEHDARGGIAELLDHAHQIDAVLEGKWIPRPEFERLWAEAREWIANG